MSPHSMQLPTMNNWDMGNPNSPYSMPPSSQGKTLHSICRFSETDIFSVFATVSVHDGGWYHAKFLDIIP